MRLHSLALTNFRQHCNTRIEFDAGLTGIIGANGSGKSTVLEAIAWAIYGTAAARGTRESIRFHRAAPRAPVRVELDFELGGHRYRVARGLTSAEVYLDGAPTPIANSIGGVTEVLRKRLGMSRDEFFNTYFTGQKELSVMAAMRPEERGQFLSRVLGYERLRSAQDLLRRRRSVIHGEVAGLKQGMLDADQVARALRDSEARLADARERARAAAKRRREAERVLADVRPRWEGVQRERERMQALLAELRVAESEEAALLRDRDRLDRELAEATAARADLERVERELAPWGALAAEFQRLEVLAREEGRRTALLDQREALDAELGKLGERRAKLESAPTLAAEAATTLEARRAEMTDVDERLARRRSEWARDQQEAETKRDTLRAQYHELKTQHDQLVKAGKDGKCPTCTRPLGETYDSVMAFLTSQIETLRVDGKYFAGRLEQLKQLPEDIAELTERRRTLYADTTQLERRVAKIQAGMHELRQLEADIEAKAARRSTIDADLGAIPAGYDARRHETVRRELNRLAPVEQRAARLRLQLEREPRITAERARVTDGLAAVARRLEATRAQRAASSFSEEGFAELRARYTAAADEARAAELAAVTADGDAAAARAALETAEAAARELAERQRLLDELGARLRLHNVLDEAYKDLRAELNTEMRPELSELASSLLADLTDGRYTELELDDQYNIIVHEDELPKPVISGGEEDLANLVLRLAISQMIAERAGQPLSLLILDEIFGSLDEARRANVLDLLRRLHDRFEQVIVITHIESVREAMDRVISVRYDEASGSSVVEQADGGVADMGAAAGAGADAGGELFGEGEAAD